MKGCAPGNIASLDSAVKVRTVSTHTHDAMPNAVYRRLNKIGHYDFKPIPAGDSWEMPVMNGPGRVVNLWMTMAGGFGEILRRKKVRAHTDLWICVRYDSDERPAIEAPLGLFLGNGTTRVVHYASRYVGMTSGGYYSYLPMPFAKACRISFENRGTHDIDFFYAVATYHEIPQLDEGEGYLYASYRDETYEPANGILGSTIPHDPHIVLDASDGPGSFVGLSLCIRPTHWLRSRWNLPYFLFPYLEGNLKFFADGEVCEIQPGPIVKPVGSPRGPQSVEWTGVEDYFLSGWYYTHVPYAAGWHGCPVRSYWSGVVSQFRFHELDPYPWRERARMTLTRGEFDDVPCRMESLVYYYRARG